MIDVCRRVEGCLIALGEIASWRIKLADVRRAVRLLAAENWLAQTTDVLIAADTVAESTNDSVGSVLLFAQESLGEDEFAGQCAVGSAMTLDQAIDEALRALPFT